MSEHSTNRRPNSAPAAATETSEQEYKVGPGRPPKEYRFKPGQSGNPKGAKRKPKSMAPDLKVALERALNKTIKLKQGEKEQDRDHGSRPASSNWSPNMSKVTVMPGAT